MVNQAILEGKWNEIRGKLKEKWAQLTDDDVMSFDGNVDQLVGRLQRKTGETKQSVERFLETAANDTSSAMNRVRETVENTAHRAREMGEQAMSQARDTVRQTANQAYDAAREGIEQAEHVIQDRPAQSVLVAFGVGVVAGVGLTLLLRQRQPEPFATRCRSATEQFGKNVLDALASALPESVSNRFRG